jgi:RNA recognition motif-containing protein
LNGHPLDFCLANQKLVNREKVKKNKKHLHSSQVITVALKQIKSPLRSQTSNAICKVQWYAPSRCAWVYLKTRRDADIVTTSCNNQKLQDRVIITGFKAPRSSIGRYGRTSRQIPTSFSVWFGNLDESVRKADLIHFIFQFAKIKVDSVSIGELSFKESESAQIIRTLLERHGPILSIELGKERLKTSDLKRKALVRFANDEHAQRACQYFQHVQKVDELGGSRLYIQRIVTLKYTFPENTLDVLKPLIQNVLHEFPSVRYTFYDNMRSKTILISADDSIILEALKLRLEPLVRGEVVKERKGGSILWNNFLSSNEFKTEVIQEFGHDVSATIWCDRRRREVRVFGPSEHRLKTIKCVQKLCDERLLATFSVPVTEDQYKYILQAGRSFLDRLKLATACRKVSVDLKNKALLVEGGETEASRVMSQVSRLIIKGSSEDIIDYDTFCPICFCPPDEETVSPCDSVRLSCKHVYCSDCFRCWLTGFNTCEFPLRCVSDGCNKLVSLDDIGKILTSEILASFLRSAFDDYVRKNLMQYQFCLVPTCPGVYEIKNSVCRSICSTCSLVVCIDCNASHGAMTCQQYKLSTLPPDQLRMQIVDDILTLRCPRCKQAFLDFDGCFAISCHACPCNFCGWCLMDCQGDAHPHVKECRDRHPEAQSYFGSQIQFQQAQNKKRVEKLKIFLKDYTVANRVSILESIKSDLVDLGISTDMLV